MATSKLLRVKEGDLSLNSDNDSYSCDACGSTNITEARAGCVCRNCGLVLSSLVLEYHRPYEVSKLQHSPEGKTQIGSYRERVSKAQSVQLKKWQRLDSERTHEENMKKLARREIKRILSGLNISLMGADPVFKRFWGIRKRIRPGTKFRSVERLVPITIYLHYKLNCKGISEQELLEISQITKKEFNSFKLQLHAYFPSYQNRDRKDYVLKRIYQLTEEFKLGMEFYHSAKDIMYRFWEVIKNTKDDVIAGVVCSIVALCQADCDLRVNAICSHLGIQMSTIQRQVEHNVFNHLRVKGFISLVRSSDLLKKVMVKLGLIKQDERILSVISIKLGEGVGIYNAHNDEILPVTPNMLVVQTTSGSYLLLDEGQPLYHESQANSKHIIQDGISGGRDLSIQFTKYEYPKGPPKSVASY